MDESLRDWSLRFCWRYHPGSLMKGFSIEYDEVIVGRAIKYLLNSQAPPKIHRKMKNGDLAMDFIDKGEKNAQFSSWESLLKTYTYAVMHAPPNSTILAQAYGKCSAALYKGELYKESLLNSDRALAIGYPNCWKAKLYCRRAWCYYRLNGKIMCREVQESVNEARKWLGEMADINSNINYITDVLDQFSTDCSELPSMQVKDCDEVTAIIPDDNTKIMRASSAIELKYSEKYGRHVVAARDIKAGEILLGHTSYASIIHPDVIHQYCWYCSNRIYACVPCHQCVSVIYCDETCRDLAWQEHHDLECHAITAMIYENMSTMELICLRLAVKAYKEAGSFENLKKKLLEIETIEDPILQCYDGDKFDNTKYCSVFSLLRKYPVLSTHAMRSSIIVFFLGATTEIFGRQIKHYGHLRDTKWTAFMGALVLRHIQSCFNGAVGELERGTQHVIRLQLNPFLSLWNHSCDPNVFVHTSGNKKIVIALKDIKADEQIYLCYLPEYWNIPTSLRVKFFKDSFNFMCKCQACEKNWQRYIHMYPPSCESEPYHPAFVNQWTRIAKNFPGEKRLRCSYVSLYMMFFA